jgi:hypothetical protein
MIGLSHSVRFLRLWWQQCWWWLWYEVIKRSHEPENVMICKVPKLCTKSI